MKRSRKLLSENGSIWVSIDDNEGHYLKVIMDEVFGRNNFVANVVWQKRTSRENRAAIGSAHDDILVYALAGAQRWKDVRNRLEDNGSHSNPDNDPRGAWRSIPFSAQGYRPNQMYDIETPSGAIVGPPSGRCWGATEPVFKAYLAEGRVYFPNQGSGRPRIKQYQGEESGLAPMTWWDAAFAGDNQIAKKEILSLFNDDIFRTPKPERLLQRILHIATNPGDLVLDSFLGSGTTAAVAHKMGRHYIGVEYGQHAETHCAPRLRKVIEGERGGISAAVDWSGGGGFKFYRLGPALFDEGGRIAEKVRFKHLAAHVWFCETGAPFEGGGRSPLLGIHESRAIYLLFNGILGDKSADGGNVLTAKVLAALPMFDGPKLIFGERNMLGETRLHRERIEFRQIPYEVPVR